MLTSSPSGTDSHLVIYLKGCLALTVLHFGSGPDKPLNNILPLANSGPVCRTHLKNMPLITSKRHMTGVSNYKVHGWSCSHSSKASLFTLFLCFTYCLSVCPAAAAFQAVVDKGKQGPSSLYIMDRNTSNVSALIYTIACAWSCNTQQKMLT